MDTLPATIEREAVRSGHRALAKVLGWGIALGALAGLLYVLALGHTIARALDQLDGGSHCDGCLRAPEGSAVRRDGQPLAKIRQVAAPRHGRRQWMVLAAADGPAIDSARAGLLRATLTAGRASDALWTVELVPPSGARGEVVALLITRSGLAPLPVYASPATQR